MARFSIAGGNIQHQLGQWLARLGARVAAGGLSAAQRDSFDPEADYDDGVEKGAAIAQVDEFLKGLEGKFEIDESLGTAQSQAKRALDASGGDEITYIQYHFDRTLMTDRKTKVQIVNVVVPDMSSKLIRDGKGGVEIDRNGEPAVDLRGVAEEAFGHVVFATCQ